MSEQPVIGSNPEPRQPDGQPTSPAAKDPDDWATGGEPATGPQLSYLSTLAHDVGESVPEGLSKADASKLIDEWQSRSTRAMETTGPREMPQDSPEVRVAHDEGEAPPTTG